MALNSPESGTELMPGFHHSVNAVSPFRSAVPLCLCDVPLYRCRSSVPWLSLLLRVRTELLETPFRIYIGMK